MYCTVTHCNLTCFYRGQSSTVIVKQTDTKQSCPKHQSSGSSSERSQLSTLFCQDLWGIASVSDCYKLSVHLSSFLSALAVAFYWLISGQWNFFVLCTVNHSCFRVCTAWVSTGHPKSRRLPYLWCWLNREYTLWSPQGKLSPKAYCSPSDWMVSTSF